jgi:hypothetical protein
MVVKIKLVSANQEHYNYSMLFCQEATESMPILKRQYIQKQIPRSIGFFRCFGGLIFGMKTSVTAAQINSTLSRFIA